MLPDGTWPFLLIHLALCGAAAAVLGRFLARDVRPGRAALGLAALGAFGLALSFLTAPRVPGGYLFAVVLAWSWTGALVMPPVLALTGVLLLRARHRSGWACTLLSGALIVAAVDGFVVEPYALEVSHHVVHSDRLARPLRIAVVADLQTDSPGPYEARALRAVMAEQPDVIIFPGDVIQAFDAESYARGWASLRAIVDEVGLHAPLGVFVTQGDVDHAGAWTAELRGTPLRPLSGPTQLREDVVLTGLDLRTSARRRPVTRPDPDALHVVAGHRPDFALGDVDAELLLAGHTHGGQVQLPFVGPLVTLSNVPRQWAAGRTDLSWHKTLFVSRGVGMERGVAPRVRFLCRPEVLIVDVEPSSAL